MNLLLMGIVLAQLSVGEVDAVLAAVSEEEPVSMKMKVPVATVLWCWSVTSTCMVQMVPPSFLGRAVQRILGPVAGRRNSSVPLTVTQGLPQLAATAEPATVSARV